MGNLGEKRTPAINGEQVAMKVEFYTINEEKLHRGEYLGYAKLIDNELVVDVEDNDLKEIIRQPFTTMSGEMDEETGIIKEKEVTFIPGTLEHLESIAAEIWRHGYISKVVE
ncbi:MAG: hypothetical protein ACQESB_04720 [Elusimicrobiota bacterium]